MSRRSVIQALGSYVTQAPSDPGPVASDSRHVGHVSPPRESGHGATSAPVFPTPGLPRQFATRNDISPPAPPRGISQSILIGLGVCKESDLVTRHGDSGTGQCVTVTPPPANTPPPSFINYRPSLTLLDLDDQVGGDIQAQVPGQVGEMQEMMLTVTTGRPDVNAVILTAAPPSVPSASDEEDGNPKPRSTQKKKVKRKLKKVMKKEEIKAEKELKKRQYKLALEACKANQFTSYYKCAKNYGVSSSTLKRLHLTGKMYVGRGKVNKVLTENEQIILSDHIKYMTSIGFGYTYYDLRLRIQELLRDVVRYIDYENLVSCDPLPWLETGGI